MNDDLDAAVDRLLRDHAPVPVADAGFCNDLLDRLPPRRPRAQWPLGIGVAAGALACWFSMQSAQVALAGWHDWLSGNLTASTLLLAGSAAGLSLLAMAWALAEAQEQAL
jgi:hypothetical protein